MTADIIEPVHLALLVADDDQTLSGNICEQILARIFQLALMPYTKPFRRKDALSLFRKNLLGDEIPLRQSLRTSRECLDGFVKGGHFAKRNSMDTLTSAQRQKKVRLIN